MTNAVTGGVRAVLRIEGLCIFLVSLWAYSKFGADWGIFALFFLAPDLSFFGYLGGPAVGAASYNVAHSYIGALVVLCAGVLFPMPLATIAALIWAAHVGFDRALGYGLKYSSGFGFTHLGIIGRAKELASTKAFNRSA